MSDRLMWGLMTPNAAARLRQVRNAPAHYAAPLTSFVCHRSDSADHWFPMQPFPHNDMQSPHSATAQLRWPLDWLRRQLRANDLWLIGLAALVGLIAAALMVLQACIAHGLQACLYWLGPDARLSTAESITPGQLLVLPLGGLLVGLVALMARRRKRPLVDAVEANALHGGRMSMRDNLIVAVQTLLSNGVGALVRRWGWRRRIPRWGRGQGRNSVVY